jgi:hypothetical protein
VRTVIDRDIRLGRQITWAELMMLVEKKLPVVSEDLRHIHRKQFLLASHKTSFKNALCTLLMQKTKDRVKYRTDEEQAGQSEHGRVMALVLD